MKKSQGVYVTKRDIKWNQLNKENQLNANKAKTAGGFNDRLRYYQSIHDVGCQCNSKTENVTCTCRNSRNTSPRRYQEVRYFSGLPKQIYTYQRSRSSTDIGVGSIKALQKKKVRRIYLPETDDRGVGSSDLSSYLLNRRIKYDKESSYYENKKTSSKCVGGIIEYKTGSVISERLSPILKTKPGITSPKDPRVALQEKNTGSNTIGKKLATVSTQVENEFLLSQTNIKPNVIKEASKEKVPHIQKEKVPKEVISVIVSTVNKLRSPINRQVREAADRVLSSDSLVQHIHNLENPSDDKQSRLSLDLIENKLEREYRKMFSIKTKDKTSVEKAIPDLKSASVLRRRFEALRRGLAKKEYTKKNDVLESKAPSQTSVPSRKDVSIASDPPSLEARSYSHMTTYSPFPSIYDQEPIKNSKNPYKKSFTGSKKENESLLWFGTEVNDLEEHGVKGMFKLWGKKFNFEEESYNKNVTPLFSYDSTKNNDTKSSQKESQQKKLSTILQDDKKDKRKFFFFKRKSKDKENKPYKPKKGVTAGRCEVKDGLMIKIGAVKECSDEPEENKVENFSEDYGDILREAWLKKFLGRTIESRNNLQIRWNNNMYATSSSTVFEILDNVYRHNKIILQSKSEISTADSSFYKSFTEQQVNFAQHVEAWMVPKLIPERPKDLSFKVLESAQGESKNNIQVKISDRKWIIDKSKAFAHKIEIVLHSKNIVRNKGDSNLEYLRIDIPKGFFSDTGSESGDRIETSNSEEVYKIVEYDTPESSTNIKVHKGLDTGDNLERNLKVTVSVKGSNHMESKILETVIKRPPIHRDIVTQGSNVYIPKKCDVIGVGIITQRDIREIRKPILKIQDDDVSDEESDRTLQNNQKKCEFAESYLQDYYKHWMPLGIDLFSWCVSDSHLGCCSEISQFSVNNQGDGTKSCPNIYDDFQASTIVSSLTTSSCSECTPCENTGKNEQNIASKLINAMKRIANLGTNENCKRILPKDSFEVFRKRKLYASSNRSQWLCADDKPYSVPSIEDKEAQDTMTECPKVKNSSRGVVEIKDSPTEAKPRIVCKKHVSVPDCELMQTKISGILSWKHGCDICKNKTAICKKHAKINPEPICEIPQPLCQDMCEQMKEPKCHKPLRPNTRPCDVHIPPCETNPCTPQCKTPSPPLSLSENPPCSPPPPFCSHALSSPSPTACEKSLPKPSEPCSPPPCPHKTPSSSPPVCKKPSKPCGSCAPPPCPSKSISPSPPICHQSPKSCPHTSDTTKTFSQIGNSSKPHKIAPCQEPLCPKAFKKPSPTPSSKVSSSPRKAKPCPLYTPHKKVSSPKRKICPMCKESSSSSDKNYPAHKTPCPAVKKSSSSSQETSPVEKKSSSSCKSTCPANKKVCPTHKKQCPAEKKSSSSSQECPAHKKQCPAENKSSSSNQECPAHKKQCPAENKSSSLSQECPAHKKQCPAENKSSLPSRECPAHKKQCPAEKKSSSSSQECPAHKKQCPAEKKSSSSNQDTCPAHKKVSPKSSTPACKHTCPVCRKIPLKPLSPICKKIVKALKPPPPCKKTCPTCIQASAKKPKVCIVPSSSCKDTCPGHLTKPPPSLPCCNRPQKQPPSPLMDNSSSSPTCCPKSKHEVSSSQTPSCGGCKVDEDFPWPTKNQVSNQPSLMSCASNGPPQHQGISLKELPPTCPPKPKSKPIPVSPVRPKSNPKLAGLFLKMQPSRKCAKDCASEENIVIRVKKETPSTEEIREGLNIKVQDADGQTLYERRDYRQQCSTHQDRSSLIGDMYNVHRVSTTENKFGFGDKSQDDIADARSEASIVNMIEINFKIKVSQGDKATEIKLGNEDNSYGTKPDKTEMMQKPQDVFVVKDESKPISEDLSGKNDINIRIIIKNYKPKTEKHQEQCQVNEEYNQKICDKFHTVSTGYSHVLGDDKIFSIHRATVDLTSSVELSKSLCKPSEEIKIQELTEDLVATGISNKSINIVKDTAMGDVNLKEVSMNNHLNSLNVKTKKNQNMKDIENSQKEKSEMHMSITDGEEDRNNVLEINNISDEHMETILEIKNTNNGHPQSINANEEPNFYHTPEDKIIKKPRSRQEKKEMLKKIFEKVTNSKKMKNKDRMKQLRNMLKIILTSDSSDPEDLAVPSNHLAKDLTFASLKPNYFRDTDSMNNVCKINSTTVNSDEESKIKPMYPTEEQSLESKDSDSSEYPQNTVGSCLCSTVAERLNQCNVTNLKGGCCCRDRSKIDEETCCDFRSEVDSYLLNYKINHVDIETQNSVFGNKINNSMYNLEPNDIKSIQIPAVEEVEKSKRKVHKTFSPHMNHMKECEMKKFNRKTVLGISEEDNIILLKADPSSILIQKVKAKNKHKTKNKRHEETKRINKAADILQSYETKKAVLEIYAEKRFSDDGERLVAKLPKFVYGKESEIQRNYEEIVSGYNSVAKKNIVMTSIKR